MRTIKRFTTILKAGKRPTEDRGWGHRENLFGMGWSPKMCYLFCPLHSGYPLADNGLLIESLVRHCTSGDNYQFWFIRSCPPPSQGFSYCAFVFEFGPSHQRVFFFIYISHSRLLFLHRMILKGRLTRTSRPFPTWTTEAGRGVHVIRLVFTILGSIVLTLIVTVNTLRGTL